MNQYYYPDLYPPVHPCVAHYGWGIKNLPSILGISGAFNGAYDGAYDRAYDSAYDRAYDYPYHPIYCNPPTVYPPTVCPPTVYPQTGYAHPDIGSTGWSAFPPTHSFYYPFYPPPIISPSISSPHTESISPSVSQFMNSFALTPLTSLPKDSALVSLGSPVSPNPSPEVETEYSLHSNVPYFEKTFYRDHKTKKKISKSAYVIALIDRIHFIEYGAKPLQGKNDSLYTVYHVLKKYDGSPTNETCALLGIPIRYWNELLLTEGDLLDFIKSSPDLSHIQDIHKLGMNYINDPLFRFRYAFRQIIQEYNPDVLLLLNIEPRGNGRLEKSYPIPLITIPGGRMEDDKDYHSFERCGLREFYEETGINIDGKNIRLCDEKVTKKRTKGYTPSSHHSSYQERASNDYRVYANFNQQISGDYSSISMFYLVRINQSILHTSPYMPIGLTNTNSNWTQKTSSRPIPMLTYTKPPGL